MFFHRQRQLFGGDTAAVVLDGDQNLAALHQFNLDISRPGVEAVLDQLLDDRKRTFNDFAGRDLARQFFRQTMDRHYSHLSFRARETSL